MTNAVNVASLGSAMVADSSGNVGIGTASPNQKLDVVGYVKASGANKGVILGENGCVIIGDSATLNAAKMLFFTADTERMRILSGGAVCVGTNDTFSGATFRVNGGGAISTWIQQTNSSTNSGLFVYLQGNRSSDTSNKIIFGGDDLATRFQVLGNGNVQNTNNSYGSTSDIKLKENVVDATPKLHKLSQVRIVNYNLKGEEQKQIGVIAQELEQIFPSMVEEHKDTDREGNDLGTTTKSVKYSVFVPMLVKAIQEQQTMIEELKTKVAALEAK